MFLDFMSQDEHILISTSEIRKVEEIGDKLTVTYTDGTKEEFEYVVATDFTKKPNMNYWTYTFDDPKTGEDIRDGMKAAWESQQPNGDEDE